MKSGLGAPSSRISLLVAAGLSAAFTPTSYAATQPLLTLATDHGPVSAAAPVEFTLWLKLHDEQKLDALVAEQQAGKAGYLSTEELRARHAPSAVEVDRVSGYLKSHGFAVRDVAAGNLYVKASGTAAQVQSAFRVNLHAYELHGRSFNASDRTAAVPADLTQIVAAVGGLSEPGAEPQIARAGHSITSASVHRSADAEGLPARPMPLDGTSDGVFFSTQCLFPPTTVSFTSSDGTVVASYQGSVYGAPLGSAPPNAAPCGYAASDVQTAYGLRHLYREGLDGTGTTIAIVDAYGSTTIANDVQAFSQIMGLPPANLEIIGTATESNFSTDANAGWATETTLDVEWVHSIAPGAKILLVVAPTNSFSDLFSAIVTAAQTPGVVAISNSWSGFDIGITGQASFYTAADSVLKAIGAAGIAVNFSTGDYGNNASQLGGLYTSTGWPASSPHATGVGGLSAVVGPHGNLLWQTSWGTTLTEIADKISLGSPPIDPINNEGFIFGGSGGESDVYLKPWWQQGVPGTRRQTPDISWLADPYTGVEIIYSIDTAGDLGIETIGGTSLSCPMFTALWGIANQNAHHRLGQAAPHLYRLPNGAITDVTNLNSAHNVTGTVTDPSGTSPITARELAAPLQGLPSFVSALYNSPHSTRWFVLTFGLDSTLPVGPGWDPATGLGAPNPYEFVHAFDH